MPSAIGSSSWSRSEDDAPSIPVVTFSGPTAQKRVTIDEITYQLLAFLVPGGTFTVSNGSLVVDYIVVGGGGSGGLSSTTISAGGGGAGGLKTSFGDVPLKLNPCEYSIVVGAGANGISGVAADGLRGNESRAFGVVAPGGGGGRFSTTAPTTFGGSGGGGRAGANARGLGDSGTSPFGNQGGAGASSSTGTNIANGRAGGGGGGAGHAGGNGKLFVKGGDGGRGIDLSEFIGTNEFSPFPLHYIFAGGGGGYCFIASGSGGVGGGGMGGQGGGTGDAHSGGGGGGNRLGLGASGAGGSGVVIIRWRLDDAEEIEPPIIIDD